MNCHEAREWLPHDLNDELSASEHALLRAHLAECESCFAELQTLSAMQRQLRAGLQVAADYAEPASGAWHKLHASIQAKRNPPARQPRRAFFLRAIGAAFATLSVMVGAAVLRPTLMGDLAPASEAPAPARTSPTVTTLLQPVRTQFTAADPDHKQLVAFLKSEPNQSVRTAISALLEADARALDDSACRFCLRMQ